MFEGLRKHQRAVGHWGMELLVVFAGVLIALSAQAWAEERSSKARADAAEIRIQQELGGSIFSGVERVALHACLKQRLVMLADSLSRDRTDWRRLKIVEPDNAGRRAFARLYRVPSRLWVTSEYHGSVDNGALDALSAERSSALASISASIESRLRDNEEEQLLAARLAALQYATSLRSQERNELIATLMRLDYLNGMMVVGATQSAEMFRKLYPPTPEEVELARSQWRDHLSTMRENYGDCVDAGAIGVLDERLL